MPTMHPPLKRPTALSFGKSILMAFLACCCAIARAGPPFLTSVPPGTSIPLSKRDRLRELAWAIYLGGDPDHAGAAAIEELMARKVDSRAPPFGIVALDPKRFCRVLGLLAGPVAVARHAYCIDPKVPYEQ